MLILPQRQTVLVAQQAADVDLFSGGRLRLGVGTGWNYVEYDALGQDFATRGARQDEQIELLRRLWTEPLVDYEGRFDRIDGRRQPPPGPVDPDLGRRVQRAGLPAGRPPRRRLHVRRPSRRRRDRLGPGRHHLDEAGRSGVDFGADYASTAAQTVDDVVVTAERWAAAGGTHLSVVSMRMGFDSVEAHVDFFGQVRDTLARTGAAATG